MQGGQSGAILKNLYIKLDNTASGDKVFTVRANGENTDITVTLGLMDLTGSDTTHNYSVGDYDDLCLSAYFPGPTFSMPCWGLVCYIAPGEEECSPSISLNTYSWSVNGGSKVTEGSNYTSGLTYFTITNNSGGAVTITIGGTDMTGGGHTWDLSDDGSAGDMIYGLYAGLDDGDDNYDVVVREDTPYNTLVSGLADEGTQDFGLNISVPTNFDDGNSKSGTITLTAVCD